MGEAFFIRLKAAQDELRREVASELASLAVALREGTLLRWSYRFVLRQCWLWALLGTLVIGLGLPILLVAWNGIYKHDDFSARLIAPFTKDWFEALIILSAAALLMCGPIAMALSTAVYLDLRKQARAVGAGFFQVARRGVIISGLIAFLNIPGYSARILMDPYGVPLYVRLPLLFVVAGVSCGVWIGWQAWRATHEEAPFFPRYSLKWMMIIVLSWGAVLAVYAPR